MPGPSLTQTPTQYQSPRCFWLSPTMALPSAVTWRRPLKDRRSS